MPAATLEAGGKRLRPMLVLLCAGPGAGEAAIRAATAIELVHMATLVHDDVLDAAPLRRGRPTVVAHLGPRRATGRRRPAVLSSLRRARRRRRPGRRSSSCRRASVALALGELAQRRDAFDISISARALPERCGLKTARLFECACLIGRRAGCAATGRRRCAADLRSRDRARLPAPRRRPRRHRPAGADRQGARDRPARRDGDPAADPGRRARPVARASSTCGRSTPRPPRRSASGSPPPARWRRCARARAGGSSAAKRALTAGARARTAPAPGAGRRRRRRALLHTPRLPGRA